MIYTLAVLGSLLLFVIFILMIHHDGVLVGEERGRNDIYNIHGSNCRMQEGSVKIQSHKFYNQQEVTQ